MSCLQAAPICLTHHLSPKSFFSSEEAEVLLLAQKMETQSEIKKELAFSFGSAIKKYEKEFGSDFAYTGIDKVVMDGAEAITFITDSKAFKFPSDQSSLRQWQKLTDLNRQVLNDALSEFILPFKIIDNVDLSVVQFSSKLDTDEAAGRFKDSDLYKEKLSIFIQDKNDDTVEKYLAENPQNKDLMNRAIISLQNSLIANGYYYTDHSPNNLVYKFTADGQLKVLVRDIGGLKKIDEKTKTSRIAELGVFLLLSYWNIDNYDLLRDQTQMLFYLDKYIEQLQKDDPYQALKSPILQAA